MGMTLIEGHYEIVGAAPDGDSVRFYPKGGKADWKLVRSGKAVRSNQRGGAQLRLDGIDALETHYNPEGGAIDTSHQPLELGHAAAEGLLNWLGFSEVERGGNEVVLDAKPKQVAGYILTRFSDKYGRCVSFAFKGDHPKKTGADVFLDVALLRKSLNYHMLETGLAYPTFYSKLFFDLRNEMTAVVKAAQEAEHGVWSKDKTMSGYEVGTLEEIANEAFVVPKLYRRLMDYFDFNGGRTSLDGFKEHLNERNDQVLILSRGQITGFDVAVEVDGQSVALVEPIEGLVFQEE